MAKFNVTCGCPTAEVWTEEQVQTTFPICKECKQPYRIGMDFTPPTKTAPVAPVAPAAPEVAPEA